MPQPNDDAVVYGTNAHFLIGATSVTKPTLSAINAFISAGTAISGLTELGHTSLDEVVAFGSDGGDSEVKGSLQNRSLKEVITSDAVDYLTVKSLQLLDNVVLDLYYGGGNIAVANEFALPDTQGPQEKALLCIIQSGSVNVGFFVKRSSVKRDDAIEVPADDFAGVPLRFTFLKASGQPKAVWIAAGLGTP